MLIYLADLVHNYFLGLNTVPLNIAYIAAYAKSRFGDQVQFRLFKYVEELLDAVDNKPPSLVGLSNYTWNYNLNTFAGNRMKEKYSHLPIVMGGPNIRLDGEGIGSFLKINSYVDIYCLLEGELPFARVLESLLNQPSSNRTGEFLRTVELDSCYSISSNRVKGRSIFNEEKELDYIPSPYIEGFLDPFLVTELLPLFETNRGCPYSCSYCNWGISARKKLKTFSLDRVRSEFNYVANKNISFPLWIIADANFGILKRDVEIASYLRQLYDELKPFNNLQIWWDKNAQSHIVENAKILKGLSDAYIAFQTFDPAVMKMINRRNISVEKLKNISKSLFINSDKLQTDILLGLPGETTASHINSLNTAFNLGFDNISGGAIRLLPGSELETEESRERFGLKTKYRLIQEAFGVYKGEFVFELEESIRATKWITEEEMSKLRILRAIFYGSVTIGEYLPLMKYLRNHGISIFDLFDKLIETRRDSLLSGKLIDWLIDKSNTEWFEAPEEADRFFSSETNKNNLLRNPVIKLNHDFLSNLLLSYDKYRAFSDHIYRTISRYFPSCEVGIVRELLILCKKRNYIMRCLEGNYETSDIVELSRDALNELEKAGCIPKDAVNRNSCNGIDIAIDESSSNLIRNYIRDAGDNVCIQTISMITQRVRNIYMMPKSNRITQDKLRVYHCSTNAIDDTRDVC
jgi:radical SAM superfamily enzyme YgiQ (UPF0313 family)